MRAAPVAGDLQVRVIRICAACAHAPDDLELVRALVREGFGFEARFGHFPIVGLCPACAGA